MSSFHAWADALENTRPAADARSITMRRRRARCPSAIRYP